MIVIEDKIASLMRQHYGNLNEKSRRQYAALESIRLGWGGISKIHSILGLNRDSINLGRKELLDIEVFGEIELGKQRRKGGGRKKKLIPNPKSNDS